MTNPIHTSIIDTSRLFDRRSTGLLADSYANQFDWVVSRETIHFSQKKIAELIEFVFHVTWLVVDSIRFYRVDGWVDRIYVTGVIESIQFINPRPDPLG